MKRKNYLLDFKEALKDLETKKNKYLHHRFTKYIVDYKIEDEHIKIISNIGNYRIVKNSRSNINKINQAIVKNKIDIANKIDTYEKTNKSRFFLLLFNLGLVSFSGILIPLSFFTGIYLFFLLSILVFSISTIAGSMLTLELYVTVKEIQNLKRITGYKKENEFQLPKINVKLSKSRN